MLSTRFAVCIEGGSTEHSDTPPTLRTAHAHLCEATANRDKFTWPEVHPAWLVTGSENGNTFVSSCLKDRSEHRYAGSFSAVDNPGSHEEQHDSAHIIQSSRPATRNTLCSVKVHFPSHPNYDLDLYLGLLNIMVSLAVQKQPPKLFVCGRPRCPSRMPPNLPTEPNLPLLHSYATSTQSVQPLVPTTL